jgi:hypothetical protein
LKACKEKDKQVLLKKHLPTSARHPEQVEILVDILGGALGDVNF